MACVADSDRFGRSRKRKFVVGAGVTENLPAIPAVVLQTNQTDNICDFSVQHCELRLYATVITFVFPLPFFWRWRTPSHTAYSVWLPCLSAKPVPPETNTLYITHKQFRTLTTGSWALFPLFCHVK